MSNFCFVLFMEFSSTPRIECFTVIVGRREQVSFSMAIEHGELMHECSPDNKIEQQDTARLQY